MRSGISSRAALALAAVFVLALLLRFAWLAETDSVLLPMSDPQYYHATAQNLAEGRGYSVAVDQRGFVAGDKSEGTAFWPPGYPLALAPLYKLFGADIRVAKAFNAVAGALTVLPVFVLGWGLAGGDSKQQTANGRRGGKRQTANSKTLGAQARAEITGLLAAALFAVSPALIFWTASLFSESLFTLGVASTLAVAWWAGERRSLVAYFAAGIVVAATTFVRSQGMLMIVPVAVLLLAPLREASSSRALGSAPRSVARVAMPVLAAILLLVVPWAVRNQGVMGRPYLINDNLGYNLRLAHGPYSKGTSVAPQDLWDDAPGISFKQREILFDDEGRSRALTYAREHPGREVQLAFRRIGYLLQSDAEASVQWSESLGATPIGSARALFILLGDVWYYPMMILAAISLVAVARTSMWWALWSALAIWGALHLVFAGEPRYHVPLLPAVVALAAGTIMRVAEMLTSEPAPAADAELAPAP